MFTNKTNLHILRAPMAVIILVTSGILCSINAQDLHYSQFYNAPMTVSPALTGIFNGDQRFTASLRDQWRSVPVPWFTVSGSYDRKFYPANSQNGFFGAGLSFIYDKQGDSNLQLINVNLSGSYTRLLNENNLITIGALVGYGNRGFDPNGLLWDKQWDFQNNVVVPSLPSGEAFDFESFSFIETGLGLNYRWQNSERTHIDLGAGGYHLTQPSTSFHSNGNDSYPIRLSIYGIGTVALTSSMDLQLDIIHQRQTSYREWLFGGYLNFYLNQQRGKETEFRIGAGYRTTGSLFPKAGLEYKNIFVALSYDIDMSEFSEDHSSTGGPEIHFRYIIKHVKPRGKFKICPIF